MRLLLAVLGATALLRLYELHLSRERRRSRDVPPERAYPLMVLLHLSLFVFTPLEVVALDRPLRPTLAAVALVILATALALRIWVIRTLGSAWNVRVLRPERVVSEGPYAYVRHPNYVVVALELFAIPLLHSAWLTLATLGIANALVVGARVRHEEALLMELPEYRASMGDKPRFLPRLTRRSR